jgi:diguanylate cyclase (GGDEF)-like protein/PAS domain S-box-containing protein
VSFLNQFKLREKIRASFGLLISLMLVNALVVGLATYATLQQRGYKESVNEALAEIYKVRLLVARSVSNQSRSSSQQVFSELQIIGQKMAEANRGLNDVQLQAMQPLLDEFKRQFQQYVVEADQRAALKSRAVSLGKRMAADLEAARDGSAQRLYDDTLDAVQTQAMVLLVAGQSLQFELHQAHQEQMDKVRQALTRLRRINQQMPADEDLQRLMFRLQRDATDYETSLLNYWGLQQRNYETEQRLNDMSDTLQQSSQQASRDVERTIRSQITLAVALVALIFLLTSVSSLVLSRYLAHEIRRPIRELVNVTQRIGQGDLQARADTGVDDEIGELASSFNDMTQRLLNKNQALALAQQQLEQRVFERTRQLADANASLTTEMAEREQAQHDVVSVHQALAGRELMLRQIIDTAPIGIFLVDMAGRITRANIGMTDMFGYPMQTLMGMEYVALVDPVELDERRQKMLALMNSEIDVVDLDRRYHRANGEPFWAHLTGKLLRGAGGEKLGLVGVIADITERKRAEEKLQLAANVFTYAREGIVITDAQANILEVNDTFTEITGYTREEVLGQNPRMLKSSRHPSDFYLEMWQDLLKTDQWYGEVWNQRKNGETYAEMLTISAVRGEQGQVQHYVALFSDITPMKEYQQQLENIAHFDALTQLPNRLLLADRLHQAMSQCQRRGNLLAVAYLDLDGFKAINDTFGHDAGDELLMALAQSMKSTLREGDTLARIGGDEFVAVLVDLNHFSDHEPLLQRLLQAASSPVSVATKAGRIELQVSASIGVTLYPQDNADADLLMRHADQAMYLAKQSGKNRYRLFDVAHDEALKFQMESLTRIQAALTQREFVLYYQPKLDLITNRITGAEALIRWQHPERGLLAPASFLPVIEDHPLSVELGEWVITTALAQMQAWQDQGLYLPVSVNIGARQLQQDGFAERLAGLLAGQSEVAPGQLQLEVLETSSLEDLGKVGAAMAACQKLGVGFALDDFGTGYSSLTYLRRLPAETLKIDQSFVRDMLDDPNDLAIVNGVIGLARAFSREVIAEGVETLAHGRLLADIGCSLAQGYGIAKPMAAADLPRWIDQWHSAAVWTA